MEQKDIKELDELVFFCRKIVQAFRIRSNCMMRRHELLLSIDHNFDNVAKNAEFYAGLSNTLARERSLLDVINNADSDAKNNIRQAIRILRVYRRTLNSDVFLNGWNDFHRRPQNYSQNFNRELLSMASISSDELLHFIDEVISFLDRANYSLSVIESRIKVEERFLQQKDAVSFSKFMLSWKAELKENEELVKHFKKLMNRNAKIIKIENANDGLPAAFIGSGSVGAFGVWNFTSAYLKGPLRPIVMSTGVGLCLIFIILGLVYSFAGPNPMLTAYEKIYKLDDSIIKKLEKEGIVKVPWWKKMFSS